MVVSYRREMERLWFTDPHSTRDHALWLTDSRCLLDVRATEHESQPALCLEGVFRHSASAGYAIGDDHVRFIVGGKREEYEAIAHMLRHRFDLPRAVIEARHHELLADPHAYHHKLIRTYADWDKNFERGQFGIAWLEAPFNWTGIFRAEVTGLWESAPGRGYGHLGAASANLVAFDFALLDVKRSDGWTVYTRKLKLETAQRVIVLETDSDRLTHYRLRHRGRPLPMYLERLRREPPSPRAPKGGWTSLGPATRVEWLPLHDILAAHGTFRHEGSIRLEPEGFADVPWITGYRDIDDVGHILRFTFDHDTTRVEIRWYEIPKGVPGPRPYTHAEVVSRALFRISRFEALGKPEHCQVDLELAHSSWAALSTDDRKKFPWEASTRKLLRDHEFDGALALFGPEKPRLMNSNGAIEAYALLYSHRVESPHLEASPNGAVRVSGIAPTEEAKRAIVDALIRDGYAIEDLLSVGAS